MDKERQKEIRTAEKYINKMQYIIDWAIDDDYYGSPRDKFEFDTKFVASVLKNTKRI